MCEPMVELPVLDSHRFRILHPPEAESALLEVPLSSRPVGTIIMCEPRSNYLSWIPTAFASCIRSTAGGSAGSSWPMMRNSTEWRCARGPLRVGNRPG